MLLHTGEKSSCWFLQGGSIKRPHQRRLSANRGHFIEEHSGFEGNGLRFVTLYHHVHLNHISNKFELVFVAADTSSAEAFRVLGGAGTGL